MVIVVIVVVVLEIYLHFVMVVWFGMKDIRWWLGVHIVMRIFFWVPVNRIDSVKVSERE